MKTILSTVLLTFFFLIFVLPITSYAKNTVNPSILNTHIELERLRFVNQTQDGSVKRALRQLYSSQYADIERPYKALEVVEIAARESTPHEEQFKGDAHSARAYALMWRITQEKAYREKALEIIKGWAFTFKDFKVIKGYRPQKYLESAWVIPIWISALDMLNRNAEGWSATDEKQFESFITKLHRYSRKAHRDNNWGTSAMLADISYAVYMQDDQLYYQQLKKFRYYLAKLTNPNGTLNADYLSDPWRPQYTIRGLLHTAEVADNQGDRLFNITFPNEKVPRLQKVLAHFTSLFTGELENPKGLKKGNYKGAHNNKQGYQIAFNAYAKGKFEQPWVKQLVDSWNPSNTSPLFMMWDRITHAPEIVGSNMLNNEKLVIDN